jgi:hypothetical protein
MLNDIPPVLVASDLFDSVTQEKIAAAFSHTQQHFPLVALRQAFWCEEDMVITQGAPELVMNECGCRIARTWNTATIPHSALRDVADAVMRIAQDWGLPGTVESLEGEAPYRVGKHAINLYIFPGCAIVCHEDLDHYVHHNGDYLEGEPNDPTTIAPLCTLVIPEPESAHAALRQPAEVKEALTHWRKCHEGDLNMLASEHNIAIADPSVAAITSLWEDLEQ